MSGKSKVGSPATLVARFWRKVDKTGDCWLWTGCVVNSYGQIDRRGAHRVSYEINIGPIPDGLFVCHRCDNPKCVRPEHLFLGTPKENMHDKIAKGRDTRGSAVNTARLKPEDVDAIRAAHQAGETQVSIGKRFGIGQAHVSSIVREKSWRERLMSWGEQAVCS